MPPSSPEPSTLYDIRHVTVYDYAAATPFARHLLRLTPVDWPGQEVVETELIFEPEPDERADRFDTLGNRVTQIAYNLPHKSLKVTAHAQVRVSARKLTEESLATSPAWDAISDIVIADRTLDGLAPVHFLFASRFVPLIGPAATLTATSLSAGRPILVAALDLARRIKREFTYDPSATTISTPLTEVVRQKRGVCQDFAHLMISGLRAHGVPAAYVSGYLRTVPPPGQKRLEGADAMHAWVAVWAGPDWGWIGVDPTNGIMAGESHVVVAIGRDYSDVSPIDGVVVTSGQQGLRVAVDVVELPDEAAEDADIEAGAETETA
jgi:transglutaminase-like putative cysteine protease